MSVNGFRWFSEQDKIELKNIGLGLTWVPVDPLNISLSGSYDRTWRKGDQYVSNQQYNGKLRSIVAQVKQKTIRLTGRVSYNISPDLTLQYYGQPYLTRPLYDKFSWVSNPLARDFDDRFTPYTTDQVSYQSGQYSIDENRDGITDYKFSRPDFNFVQFRSNLVMRWEYRPGSELFFVWSDSNTANAYDDFYSNPFNSLMQHAFSGNSRNSFLVKFTYRFVK